MYSSIEKWCTVSSWFCESVCVCLSHQPVDDTLDGGVPLSNKRVCIWLQQELIAGDRPQLQKHNIFLIFGLTSKYVIYAHSWQE